MTNPSPTQPNRAPWPEPWWPEPPRRRAFTLLGLASGLLVLFVAVTISAATGPDVALADPFGLGALMFLLLVASV